MERRELLAILAGIAAVPAAAQDPAKVNPRSYKVLFENERLRLLEYISKPGLGVCGQGRHYHPAHLSIPLTDGKVKVTAGGKTFIADGKAGEAFWEPEVWHDTENIGRSEMRAYMVELKGKDWKPSTG
jgi:quercetin dioxygenase-like cupin family protein